MNNFRWSNTINIFTLLCLVFSSNYSKAAAIENSYQKIELYFIPWHILTRARLSPEDVKKMARVTMTITYKPYIEKIENKIAKLKFKEIEPNYPVDTRLVLELFRRNGSSDLYYANIAYIASNHSDKIADMDNEFLEVLNVFQPIKPEATGHN